MKFLKWARTNSPLTDAPRNDRHNAGRWPRHASYPALEEKLQATTAVNAGHAEVLMVGTLGIGNLLTDSRTEKEGHDSDNPDDGDDGDEDIIMTNQSSIAGRSARPIDNSTSLNGKLSGSVSETVRPVDVRKLQAELQKILYGEADWWPSASAMKGRAPCAKGGKAKGKKQKAGAEEERGRIESRVSLRELLPLHNSFVEYSLRSSGKCIEEKGSSMEGEGGSFYRLLFTKQHPGLLLQWLKSKFYSSSSASARLNMAFPVFQFPHHPQYSPATTTASVAKVFGSLQRITKRVVLEWKSGRGKKGIGIEPQQEYADQRKNEKDRSLELAGCYKVSGRKAERIGRTVSEIDGIDYLLTSNYKGGGHAYNCAFQLQENGNLKLLISTSPLLTNESWIDTDDEYLVLEL